MNALQSAFAAEPRRGSQYVVGGLLHETHAHRRRSGEAQLTQPRFVASVLPLAAPEELGAFFETILWSTRATASLESVLEHGDGVLLQ